MLLCAEERNSRLGWHCWPREAQNPGILGQEGREIQSWAVSPIPSRVGSAGCVGSFIS